MAFIVPFIPYIIGAVGAAGALQQGASANRSAQINAKLGEQQAEVNDQQTVAREELHRQGTRRLIGDQLAVGAESGVDLAGSRADILHQSLYDSELDSLNIRYGGQLQSQSLRTGAGFQREQGQQALNSGYLNAASSLLSSSKSYTSKGSGIPANTVNAPPRFIDGY